MSSHLSPSALALSLLLPLGLASAACAAGTGRAAQAAGTTVAPAAHAVADGRDPAPPPDMRPGAKLEDVAGHVEKVSDDWWGLVPDFDAGTRFSPAPALATEYRQDGLRVVWSGTVGEVRADVRMWGVPLALTAIRREDVHPAP